MLDRSWKSLLGTALVVVLGCSRDPGLAQPAPASSPSASPNPTSSANANANDAAPKATVDLSEGIASLASTYELPGVGVAVFDLDRLVASGVYGYRKAGDPVAITVDDRWALGSCTKAITATLAGILVDEHKLSFDDALDKLLPGIAVHPTRAKATLMMLLQHHAGMEREPDAALAEKAARAKDLTLARKELAAKLLGRPNEKAVGTYQYSNVGYLAAGVAIERATGKPYEALVRERIFTPLGMTSCGFGPPHDDATPPAQPVGHAIKDGKPEPVKRASETPIAEVFAPTSAIHCSLADWAKFLRLHLRTLPGTEPIVSRPSLKRLHTPEFNKTTIAGFWFEPLEWAGAGPLHQFGSSGTFYSEAWLVPNKNLVFMLATNTDAATTKAASEKIFDVLFKRFGK